jgi:transcriptional/translational regulatory protein YebC/TACO1
LVSSPALRSGHNKWSKIRHDKAANDAKKNAARTIFTKNIALYSKRTPSTCCFSVS